MNQALNPQASTGAAHILETRRMAVCVLHRLAISQCPKYLTEFSGNAHFVFIPSFSWSAYHAVYINLKLGPSEMKASGRWWSPRGGHVYFWRVRCPRKALKPEMTRIRDEICDWGYSTR